MEGVSRTAINFRVVFSPEPSVNKMFVFDTDKRTYMTAMGTFVFVVAAVTVIESMSGQSRSIDPALTLVGAIVSAVLVTVMIEIV